MFFLIWFSTFSAKIEQTNSCWFLPAIITYFIKYRTLKSDHSFKYAPYFFKKALNPWLYKSIILKFNAKWNSKYFYLATNLCICFNFSFTMNGVGCFEFFLQRINFRASSSCLIKYTSSKTSVFIIGSAIIAPKLFVSFSLQRRIF